MSSEGHPPTPEPPSPNGRRRQCVSAFLVGALLGTGVALSPRAFAATPSQDACHTINDSTPVGDCGPFRQLYSESFNAQQVPLGRFKNCAGDGDFKCAGLSGTRYYGSLGAYPSGWADTATSGADGNGGRTFGGYYRPEDTTSVIRTASGDGQLKVHMFRPAAGGSNHVSAPVPLKCMNLRYGKFTERTRVSSVAVDGFKMAHLRYTPNEVDFPEAGGNFKSDPISVFTHGFSESAGDLLPNAAWTGWHTYSQEIVPGRLRFYIDGILKKTVNADFPDAADWVLQNESALGGGYAAKGSSVDIYTTGVACYKY